MELLHSCRDHAHKYYGDLLQAAEQSLNTLLFELAEQSSNNDEQRRYYDAMQLLQSHSGALPTVFKQQMETIFQAFLKGEDIERSIDEQIDINSLTLVHREELEDELAISVIVSRANSRNSETLWKLNRRLAALRGGQPVTDESNPFGPAMVCEALQVAVTQLEFDSSIRLRVYKQLGKILVISFGKALDTLNDMLVEQGILANLRFSVSKQEQSAPATRTNPAEAMSLGATRESASSIAHQQELYSAIRKLQHTLDSRTQAASGVSYQGIPTDARAGSQEAFSPIDYALALSAIQQSSTVLSAAASNRPLPAEQIEEKLFGQLAQQADKNARHKMTSDDADTVDLVGMIFRYMLDDTKLHDAVKSLLSHLHTPYLKLALMDKDFLDNYQHGARVLLNTMAEVGSKWVKNEKDRTVLPKIKTVVETVLNDFVDEAQIFDDLLEDFVHFRENLEKRARMVEKRNTESQQGLEKLEISRQRAAEEVEFRLEQARLADNVASQLRQPWTDFLAFNLLRHGEDSLTWQSALKVVDGVIWSVRPAAVADNKADWQRHQKDLETSVSEGLKTIGYDPEASKTLLNALKEAQELAYHASALGDTKTQPEPSEAAIATSSSSENQASEKPHKAIKQTAIQRQLNKLNQPAPKLSDIEEDWFNKLKDITFGTWFEFDREELAQQLKLAWFSRVSSHYMFVDQAGVKQAVEDKYFLAQGLAAGSIRILEPEKKSFMERALEAVFNKLRMN